MIRPLLFVTAAAGLMALAACDGPSALSKAQVGECYTVVSKGSLGEPNLGKVPCADGAAPAAEEASAEPAAEVAAAEPAAEGQTAAPVTTQTAASGVATTCIKGPVCAAPSGGASYVATSSVRPKVRAGKAAVKRRVASRGRTSHAYTSGGGAREYVGLGIDYAQVDENERVKTFASGNASSATNSSSSGYSQSSSSTYSSSSSSSASGSAGYAYGAQGPCCAQGRGGQGPHSPFDQYGFLTWSGKVAYQPDGGR